MKKVLLALLIGVFGGLSQAQAVDCEFQHRPDDFFFRKLPQEIVGWIRCASPKDDMNIVFVAKTASLQRDQVLSLFTRYESTVVMDRVSTKLTQAKTNGWMDLESQRPNGSTSHIVFNATAADGTFLVFIYTDSPARARMARSKLGGLREYFSLKDQAQLIVDAIEKSPAGVAAHAAR